MLDKILNVLITDLRAELASAHADIEREVGEWNSEAAAHEVARRKLAEAEASRNEAMKFLGAVFNQYENGAPCYEDPEENAGYLGPAFRIDDGMFHAIVRVLNKHEEGDESEALTALLAAERERIAMHFDDGHGNKIATEIRSMK